MKLSVFHVLPNVKPKTTGSRIISPILQIWRLRFWDGLSNGLPQGWGQSQPEWEIPQAAVLEGDTAELPVCFCSPGQKKKEV